MSVFVVLLLSLLFISARGSAIVAYYPGEDGPISSYPEWAMDIQSSATQFKLEEGNLFNALTLVYGHQSWQSFNGTVAIPTENLCNVPVEDVPKHMTAGDVLIMPKYWGCSRQSVARKLSKVPKIKALLHYDPVPDPKAYGFSQTFTDGSALSDITIISLLVRKEVAAAMIEAILSHQVVMVHLSPEEPAWSDMSRNSFLACQITLLGVAVGVVIFSLYRLIVVVKKRIQKKLPLVNISVVVILLETLANIIRLALYATLPNLSADGLNTLSYPAWRILVTFHFPIECMASSALVLYWHELLLMKMKNTKLAFMTNTKSKIGFGVFSLALFATDVVTGAMDAAAYDVSFFIVIGISIFYMLIITIGTYYVGYKVLKTVKNLPHVKTVTIKLIISASFVWVVIIGAIFLVSPLYWSVTNQAWMTGLVFIGMWGTSVFPLTVFKQRTRRGHHSSSEGGRGTGSSSVSSGSSGADSSGGGDNTTIQVEIAAAPPHTSA